VSPDGVVSVLLTNLFDQDEFKSDEIISLYFKRWEVENYYRDEKVFLEIEKFHSKTPNGIRQELFAIIAMTVITRILMVTAEDSGEDDVKSEPQFKNSIITLASDIAAFSSQDPVKALEVFQDILTEIGRVRYYRPKKPRQSQPRVTKKPINKWAEGKTKKLAQA
jgi:Transposase DDE domain